MLKRKTEDLRKLDHGELLALARRASNTPISRRAPVGDLLEVVGRSLSVEEIKREARGIMTRRPRGKRWGRRFDSPRMVMGLIVLVIVVSSSYVAYLGSAHPQYYLVQAWEKPLVTGEFAAYVDLPLATVDEDGNLFVATTLPDNSLAKFGPTGVEEWRKTFTIEQGSSANVLSIAIDAHAEHICVAGSYADLDGNNGFLACFDSFGEVEWVRTWGHKIHPKSVAVLNGSVCVAGRTSESNNTWAFITQYNSEGNSLWNATWSGVQGSDAYAICGDDDGNVFVVGIRERSILVKYDSVGNEVWNSTWSYQFGVLGKLVRTEGGYVYALDTIGWLGKHSIGNGALIWRKPLGWAGSESGFSVDTFSIDGDGGINAGGVYRRIETRDNRLTYSHFVWVASYDSDGGIRTNITSLLRDGHLHVGTMVLRRGGSMYVIGGFYYSEIFEWKFVLMQLGAVSSFLAGTALTVSLASVACITLAVIWKEQQANLRRRRGIEQQKG